MLKKILIPIFAIVCLLALWQFTEVENSKVRIKEGRTTLEAFVPTPITIYETLRKEGGLIASQMGFTLGRALIGFISGIALGVFVAILTVRFPLFRRVVLPISLGVNSFPIVGFAPLIILAFGQGSNFSIIFISIIIAYFPVFISFEHGLMSAEKGLIETAYVFGASKWQILSKVRIPLAIPNLLNSLKLALPASIIGATMGEWLGSKNGIGQLITIALYQLRPGLLYASLLSITAVSLILTFSLGYLTKVIVPWKK